MGTMYTIRLVVPPGADTDGDACLAEAEAAIRAVDDAMSTYKAESELSRFNAQQSTDPFLFSPGTFEVVSLAGEVNEVSGGAFDITVGPLVNAWGFGAGKALPDPPTSEELAALRAHVGFGKLVLDAPAHAVTKTDPEIYCDLAAIAKGYAVDKGAEALESMGIRNYLVEVGGEVRTGGLSPRGEPWRIGINRPDAGGNAVQRAVPMSDLSMATSGDYRNYYEIDGKRYSHTIDPRTGRPVEHQLASVTVLHPRCAMADAYATALLVLGPEDGLALAKSLDLAAYFILRKDDGFEERETGAFTACVTGTGAEGEAS